MKIISQTLIFAMFHLCWFTSYGWAEMVPTESTYQQFQVQDDRQRLLDLLNRQDVVDELEKNGLSKVEAVARINSLSDEEVMGIAGKLDQLPSGGNVAEDVLYVLLLPLTFAVGVVGTAVGLLFSIMGGGEPGVALAMVSWVPFIKNIRAIADVEENPNRRGIDISAGLSYCLDKCESDLSDCLESAEGEGSAENECADDKVTCESKCSNWAEGQYH